MNAATGGVSGWPSSQATPISRTARGAGDRQFDDSRAGHRRWRQQGDAEARRDQAAQGLRLLALEGDARAEARLLAQVVGDAAQAVAGFEGDEGFVGRLGEADAPAGGEAVVGGDDQAQLLFVQAAGDQVRGVRDGRGQAQVQLARAQPLEHRLAVVLDEAEADAGVVGAEGADQARARSRRPWCAGSRRRPCRWPGRRPRGPRRRPARSRRGPVRRSARKVRPAGVRETVRPLAGEQVDAQVLFEADHGPGERGLRDLHLLGGAGDVLGAGDAGEVREARGEQRDDVAMSSVSLDGDRRASDLC